MSLVLELNLGPGATIGKGGDVGEKSGFRDGGEIQEGVKFFQLKHTRRQSREEPCDFLALFLAGMQATQP